MSGVPVILFLFALSNEVSGQSINSTSIYIPPKVVFELGGGFNYPIQDAHGNVRDFFKFLNYGTVHGIGFNANVKFKIDKKGHFYPYVQGGFTQLQNDDNTSAFIDSNIIRSGYPLPGVLLYKETTAASPTLLILRNFYLGIGLQYMFIPAKSFMPYVGFDIDYNLLWGLYTQKPAVAAGNNSTDQVTFNINSTSRVGIGADIGFNLRISQNLGFTFGTRYKWANLFGKQSSKTQPSSENPGDLNTMNLLDKADESLNSNLNKSRDIAYLQFYLGFAVFIGRNR